MRRAERIPGQNETPAQERSVKRRSEPRRPADPLAYRVDDAAAAIGVSRSKVWELIARGEIVARKLDGSTIILRDDLQTYLDGLPETGAPASM